MSLMLINLLQIKKESKMKRKQIPWFTNALLLTILGAISILLLFGVYYFQDQGTVFYIVIFSWSVILIFATVEIGRQEVEKSKIKEDYDKVLKELEICRNKENK